MSPVLFRSKSFDILARNILIIYRVLSRKEVYHWIHQFPMEIIKTLAILH